MVFDGSGNLTGRYMYGPFTDEVLTEQNVPTGAINWQVTDHQQSVRDVVTFDGSSATVADHLAYNAYGE